MNRKVTSLLLGTLIVIGATISTQKVEASEQNFSKGVILTAKKKEEINRINSFVFAESLNGGTSYKGKIENFYAKADLKNINLSYSVNGRIFKMSGHMLNASIPYDGQLLVYAIDKVDGRKNVYKTKAILSKFSSRGRVIGLSTEEAGIVPNWGALPNLQNYSKLSIDGAELSVLPE
ncbi:hypothetical protein BH746_11735 [Enterococcus faecalis]|uniref:hypothetical protein n=1 Tax=Enterococcus faecalis TaxID=1351 RepID=UPI0009BEF961|nr:hypothetical protein [Enterococcus faecalis]OQO72567.1 hypothetical protein BH746_11735 [Enterococcus faecalis]